MSNSKLKVIKDHSEQILLAELIALLHDVGKLSSQFIDQMSSSPTASAAHFEHERAIEEIPGFIDRQFLDVLRSQRLRNLLRFDGIARPQHLGRALDLILYHDRKNHSAFLVRLLNRCDGIDSGADKGTTRDKGLPKQAKQARDQTLISTAFGLEPIPLQSNSHELDNLRAKLTEKVGQELQLWEPGKARRFDYRSILKNVYDSFRIGLGETRRSANDVTLWDHAFSVATLYKSAIAQLLYTGSLDENMLRWRLLRVNFDVLDLYAKSIRIADLLGYQEAVRRACEEVKRLIEEEYPLGNEVYQDTTGMYFTFPDIDLPAELEKAIRCRVESVEPELAPRIVVGEGSGNTAGEQLKRMLAGHWQQARRELAAPFEKANLSLCWQQQWENLSQGRWEICPVCRLRPMEEGKDACEHCWQRRVSGIQIWLSDPTRTIWLDEIADHNGRIALVVAKFGLDGWLSGDLVQTMLVRAVKGDPDACVPKNPSPARLRRVWETCQRFWTETVEGKILAKHTYGQRPATKALRCVRLFITPDVKTGWEEKVPYDGTAAGQPVSLLWNAKGKHFVTIINLQLTPEEAKRPDALVKAWRGQKVEVGDPDDPRKRLEFRIQQVIPAEDDFGQYRPYLSLLTSPDQFLALVPADDALEITEKIRQKYVEQMGKVQNRLPLFLGLVFFPRKTPLIAAMDTARRMLEQSVFKEETWTVECVKPLDGNLKCFVRLSRDDQRLQYQVPIKMGDQTTPDDWYPYFFFEGDPGPRRLRFRHNGRWFVHVNDLQEDDRVHIFPSLFGYVFLEHTAQRFAFDPNRDVVLLDEMPRLMDMWRGICQTPNMTDTKLQGIWRLFDTKWDLWKPDKDPEGRKAFEELVRATFTREGITCVTVEDVLTKRFQRCLELHLRVLKRRVKEE